MKFIYSLLVFLGGFFLFINAAAAGSINIISPIEGAVFGPSSLVDIKWTQSNDVGNVSLGMWNTDNAYGQNIANSNTPFTKDGEIYSYSFYNDRSYSEKTDKIFKIESYVGGYSDQVKVSFTPGESSNTPSSIKTSSIKVISPDVEVKEYVDSVPISWEQYGISGPATLSIINNFGTIIDSYVHNSTADGIQTYDWKINNSAKSSPNSNKYKVSVTAPTKLTGVTPVYISDESNNFFSVKLNDEKLTEINYYPVNVKINKSSFQTKDAGTVTWSSECKAPFVDVMLVKESISGKEEFIYLTPWTEGYAPYPNSSFTKNKGSLIFYIPSDFSFEFINKIYSFSYRLTDGATITSIGNGNKTSLSPGNYRIRVVVNKFGPSQMIWPGNKVEDMSSYPNCTGTGLSEPFYIGNESNIAVTPVTNSVVIPKTNAVIKNTLNKPVVASNLAVDKNLAKSLSGRILLQVESKGEAWYINPKDNKRYYMADGNAAFNIMRTLSLGMSNKDVERMKTDVTYRKKFIGQILLQVESRGEAYYISFDGRYNYLKDGAAAYEIMRKLSLGITNTNLEKITAN